MVFKILKPISQDHDYVMKVAEPIDCLHTWNNIKEPVEMHRIDDEKLYKDGEEFETWKGYALIKQEGKMFCHF